ncbi:hypothetical protein ACFC06_00505 [Nocardia sp. NPDC056064]|uniref:hypothetical protein n=1 Tax=Nocardia sp. NPDC056064 TaxID=3345701 RepID=UPI0035E1928C
MDYYGIQAQALRVSDPGVGFLPPGTETQTGTRDPAPGPSDTFDADQRMEVDHAPLRQLPRPAAAINAR